MMELPRAWAATYEADTKEELLVAYKAWAPTYDEDSIGMFGYAAPDSAARMLSQLLGEDGHSANILDVGAGTGLVGERLWARGHRNLTGVDISPAMLEIARHKKCYDEGLICCDLEDDDMCRQCLPDSHYDAAVCVGTITPNHVGRKALDTMVRCVRPGGLLCIALRDDFLADLDGQSNGFQKYIDSLCMTGVLERVGSTESELYTPHVSDEIFFRCWSYRILPSGIRGDWRGCS